MKNILIYLLLIFNIHTISICNAQNQKYNMNNSFVLKGKILGRDTGFIVLWYPDTSGRWILDTTYLNIGEFSFKGTINEVSFAHLIGSPKEGNYADIYLQNGTQTIMLEENNFRRSKTIGSLAQRQVDSLYFEINETELKRRNLVDEFDKINQEITNLNDSSIKKFMESKVESIKNELSLVSGSINYLLKIRFIINHPNSYVSPTELLGLINSLSLRNLELLYNSLELSIQISRAGLLCASEIEKRKIVKTGTMIEDFTANDINGRSLTVSQFRGKYLLIDFWASWCAPCRKNIPHLKDFYAKYKAKGFDILCISIDRKSKDWENAIKQDSTNIWHNLLSNDEVKKIFQAIQTVPAQFLIDPKGKIIWSSADDNTISWEAIIEQNMNPFP